MRFKIFNKNSDGTLDGTVTEFDYDNLDGMPMAHCDQTILHAPGKCQYCDHYPEAQRIREFWRINFTGESDPNKAPCPSEYFRPAEVRDLWPGNTTEGYLT